MKRTIGIKLPLTGKPVLDSKPVSRQITMSGLRMELDGIVYLKDVDGLWWKELDDGTVEWMGVNGLKNL